VLPTSKTLVYVIMFMSVFFFVVRKEVKKKDVEEKIKSTGTGKKKSTAKRKWKETVSYDCVS